MTYIPFIDASFGVFLSFKCLATPENVAFYSVGKRLNLKEKHGGSCHAMLFFQLKPFTDKKRYNVVLVCHKDLTMSRYVLSVNGKT